ncbi:MAG: tyrosine-type recombinase/integrase [bacterium]|nr:tyrosine-type recombinase/integrase [bacterium]
MARVAWRELLAFRPIPPWRITRHDLLDYLETLTRRRLAASTINQRLAAISSFYDFCQERGIRPLPRANPTHGIPRLHERRYESSNFLSLEEAHAFLNAIDRGESILGKRDFALFLAMLACGLEAGQARVLRWSQLTLQDDTALLHLPNQSAPLRLPPFVWDAVQDYLVASGRLETIQPDDYLFAVLAEPLRKAPSGQPTDWDPQHPLSKAAVKFLIKQYAVLAQLDPLKVTAPNLRHTAAVIHLQAGADLAGLQRFLGRVSHSKTSEYIERLATRPHRPLWKKPVRARKLRRGPNRARPGNQQALLHGFYVTHLPDEWLQYYELLNHMGVDGEIVWLRLMILHALKLSSQVKDVKESIRLLNVVGLASTRVGQLMLQRLQIKTHQRKQAEENTLEEALRQIAHDLDLSLD